MASIDNYKLCALFFLCGVCVCVTKVYQHHDGSKSLKLGDFGLATVVNGYLYTVCGTPTYVAPEIVAEKGCVRPFLFVKEQLSAPRVER